MTVQAEHSPSTAHPLADSGVLYLSRYDLRPDERNYNRVQRILFAPSSTRVGLFVGRTTNIGLDLPDNVEVLRAWLPGALGFYLSEIGVLLLARARGFRAVVTTGTAEGIPAWLCRGIGGYRWISDIWDTPHKHLVTYYAGARTVGLRARRTAARLKVVVFKRILRRSDLVIVSACHDALGAYDLLPDRTRVFPNAIDLGALPPPVERHRHPCSLCYVSSLFLADRGIDTLAGALHILGTEKSELPRAVLAGRLAEDVREYLERHELLKLFDVRGAVSIEVAHELMRSVEVGVLPFHENEDLAHTQPVKIFEYMALGAVVVASDLPGIREVVRDGVDGLLVPPGDAEGLADALRRLFDDPELVAALRAAARDRVKLFDARTKVRTIYAEIAQIA